MSDKTDAKAAVAKTTKAPKAKVSKDVNKSAEIRKVATAMKARNEKPRPVTIIEVLGKQGIEVSSPQVSMVLKRMGFRPRRRRKAAAKGGNGIAVVTTKGSGKEVRTKATKISVEDLVAAKKAVSRLGGLDRALAAIEALRQFG
jgi:transposase